MTGRRVPVVAVVGVGASGTLAALHLLRAARAAATPLHLVLVDRSGTFGPGVAYGTPDPQHLLNTPAGKVGALEGKPEHFVEWARSRGLHAAAATFLPRAQYGRYLAETLHEQERLAAGTVTVERCIDTATSLTPEEPGGAGAELALASGRRLWAGVVVLAMGPGASAAFADVVPGGSGRYVCDPWQPGALDRVGADDGGAGDDWRGGEVLVLGTGLTMVDVVSSLARTRPGAVVHAISRHGLLPRPHRATATSMSSAPAAPVAPLQAGSVGELLAQVRVRLRGRPEQWRDVVDGLRPQTTRLWQQLDVRERQRFLSRVNRFWDVHRHRLAPQVHDRLQRLRRDGRLHVHRGRVVGIARRAGSAHDRAAGFDVEAAITAGGQLHLRVGWIVDATGLCADIGSRPDPLVRQLLADDVARPDRLGLGFDTRGDDGRVLAVGGARPWLFAVGALRRGTLFESTAVPEIRAQAAAVAAAAVRELTPTTTIEKGRS